MCIYRAFTINKEIYITIGVKSQYAYIIIRQMGAEVYASFATRLLLIRVSCIFSFAQRNTIDDDGDDDARSSANSRRWASVIIWLRRREQLSTFVANHTFVFI